MNAYADVNASASFNIAYNSLERRFSERGTSDSVRRLCDAVLDTCGISRQALTEEKADIYEQLAQFNKQIRAERQKIKLCREIADSAAVMQRDVAAQEKSHNEKEASQTRAHE